MSSSYIPLAVKPTSAATSELYISRFCWRSVKRHEQLTAAATSSTTTRSLMLSVGVLLLPARVRRRPSAPRSVRWRCLRSALSQTGGARPASPDIPSARSDRTADANGSGGAGSSRPDRTQTGTPPRRLTPISGRGRVRPPPDSARDPERHPAANRRGVKESGRTGGGRRQALYPVRFAQRSENRVQRRAPARPASGPVWNVSGDQREGALRFT